MHANLPWVASWLTSVCHGESGRIIIIVLKRWGYDRNMFHSCSKPMSVPYLPAVLASTGRTTDARMPRTADNSLWRSCIFTLRISPHCHLDLFQIATTYRWSPDFCMGLFMFWEMLGGGAFGEVFKSKSVQNYRKKTLYYLARFLTRVLGRERAINTVYDTTRPNEKHTKTMKKHQNTSKTVTP